MVAIPFPMSTSPGFQAHAEGSGRLINLYAEPLGEQRGVKRVRVPGLTSFATSSETGFRGMMEVGGTVYAAYSGKLNKFTSAGGAMAFQSNLSGTASVYFARNNNLIPGPDRVVVTETGAFAITDPTGVSAITIPAQPNSVCCLDGYFLFTILSGKVYASDLNSLTVNASSVADIIAKPDLLLRAVAYGGRAHFFGTESTEVWIDIGATPFPLQRAAVVPYGLIGADAVAGWEDGFGAGLLFVSNDNTVRVLNGYTAEKVSSPDLDRLIARDPNKASILCNVYVVDGHAMFTVTGTNYSWSFDLNTQKWHERKSYLVERWRGLQTIKAYNKWLAGDRNSGNVYAIDPTNHKEGADPLPITLESGPVQKFPSRIRVARGDFNLETGVGLATGLEPIQTDPTLAISWSDDGGTSWSVPVFRKVGKQARADKNISVFRTGMSTRHGRRWRLEMSDPVYVSIFGGDQSAELRS